jgi:hypothetical protein
MVNEPVYRSVMKLGRIEEYLGGRIMARGCEQEQLE